MKFGQIWPSRGSRLSANGPVGPPSLSENIGQDLRAPHIHSHLLLKTSARRAFTRIYSRRPLMCRTFTLFKSENKGQGLSCAAHLLYLKVRTAVMTSFLTFETESIYKQEKSLEKALFQGILSFYCFQTLLIRKVSINRRNDQIP